MAVYRRRIYAVAAKIEPVSGVSSVPTFAANAVRVIGIPVLTLTPLDTGQRDDEQTGGLGAAPRSVPVGWRAEVEIVLPMTGKGNAAGIPMADPFLRAGAFGRTVDATPGSEKVIYRDLDLGHETLTLLLQSDEDEEFTIVGVACNVQRGWPQVGSRGVWTFPCRGYLPFSAVNPRNVALAGLSLPNIVAPPWKNNTVLLGDPLAPDWGPATTHPLHARRAQLDMAVVLADRPSAGASDGYTGGAVITDFRPTLSLDVEKVPYSQFHPYDAARADGLGAGAFVAHDTRAQIKQGLAQYHRETVNTGKWELEAPARPDFEGLAGWTLNGRINKESGPSGRFVEIIYD